MSPPRFFGSHELAERWGVSRQRVFQLLDEDDDMPRGEALKGARVWGIDEIEAYEQRSGRVPRVAQPPADDAGH